MLNGRINWELGTGAKMLCDTFTCPRQVTYEVFKLLKHKIDYFLNNPELCSVLKYSTMIGDFFTNSQILAEFRNQSRSQILFANE